MIKINKRISKKLKSKTNYKDIKLRNIFTILERDTTKYSQFDKEFILEQLLPLIRNTFYNYDYQFIFLNEKTNLYSMMRSKYGFELFDNDNTLQILRAIYNKNLPIKFVRMVYDVYSKDNGRYISSVSLEDDLKRNDPLMDLYRLSEKQGTKLQLPKKDKDGNPIFLNYLDFEYKNQLFRYRTYGRLETNADNNITKDLITKTKFCGYIGYREESK